jgi:hemoglobin
VEESEVYKVIGEVGFVRLIAAFYRRVPQDDILGPMYAREDLAGAEERLRDFLIFRFGGPPRYLDLRGHPRLRMRHVRFAIGEAARNRWMELMNQALEEAELPADAVEVLRPFLEGTATLLINQQEC